MNAQDEVDLVLRRSALEGAKTVATRVERDLEELVSFAQARPDLVNDKDLAALNEAAHLLYGVRASFALQLKGLS